MINTGWIRYGRRCIALMSAVVLAALVAGCGGGGGAATNGPIYTPTGLTLTPGTVETSPNVTLVFSVTGGARPYRVSSSAPGIVALSKDVLGLDEYTFSARVRGSAGGATVYITALDNVGVSGVASVKVSSSTAALAAIPATLVAYYNNPAIVTASGGVPPYRMISSNPAVISSASAWSSDGEFLIIPTNVAEDTSVTLTLVDSTGQSATVAVTVKPAPLLNVFTITPVPASPGVGCGTAVCSGQDATASVKLTSLGGGGLPGRQVRFDVVQGQYLFYSDNPAQPLVSSMTVTSDQNGAALVRLKANTNAVTGAALIRATDLVTGNQVTGSFIIAQFTDGTGTLSIVPSDVTINSFYNDECSLGVSSTLYVFGGTAPYRVVTSFPNDLQLTGSPVQTNGGGFTVTTRGSCLDPANIIVTDATGRTLTATLHNKPGTNTRPAVVPPLAVTPSSVACLADGTAYGLLITGGASTTYVAATDNPTLETLTVSGHSVTVTGSGVAGGTLVATNVRVSDGTNIITVPVGRKSTCP